MTDVKPSDAKQSGGKVVVMCKLPWGFILQLEEERQDTDPQSRKEFKAWHRVGQQISVTGANYQHIGKRGVAGFGITEVDADIWEKWKVQKAGWPPLEHGWVFASQSSDKAEGQAKEQRSMKTGLEPLDPDKPAPGIEKVPA